MFVHPSLSVYFGISTLLIFAEVDRYIILGSAMTCVYSSSPDCCGVQGSGSCHSAHCQGRKPAGSPSCNFQCCYRNGSWLLVEKRKSANVNLWTGLFPSPP